MQAYIIHYISFEQLVNLARIADKCDILGLAKVKHFAILSSVSYIMI